MTQEQKAKAYDEALERAKKWLDSKEYGDADVALDIFPELRESEKPLTPFQQCLNLVLRKVYFASIPNTEGVDKFILDIVKNHTDELVELTKKHEYADYQLAESENERMRRMLIDRLRSAEELTDQLREWILSYLEKHKEL